MALPDELLSSLEQIRIKIRRLTRSLGPEVLADSTIDDYVNTFILYDFPEHLRLFNLRTNLSFYCNPYLDVYDTTQIVDVNDPLYNFLNIYTTVHQPVYIAGYQAIFSQSPEQFNAIYPKLASIMQIGTGDGVETNFFGVLPSAPLLQNNVMFDSIAANSLGLTLIDAPLPNIPQIGNITTPSGGSNGTIDYISGTYNVTFPSAPASGAIVNAQVVQYQPARPQAVLFYAGVFTLRPVPDQPYKITMEVYKRPSELLDETDVPHLSEWWQYIAYGAAKKVFEDRMDSDSVQMIMPEFKQQERLILRRTLVQNSNVRTSTIYTDNNNGVNNTGWGFGNGGLI